MNPVPAYIECSDDIVRGLVVALNMGLFDKFPRSRANPEDLENLLDAVRVMSQKIPELEMMQGMLHIARRDLLAAAQVFRELTEARQCLPHSRAMLMYCMSENNDSEWLIEANQLLQSGLDDKTMLLVRAVMAGNDMRRAIADAKASGNFVVPDSVRILREERIRRDGIKAEAARPVPSQIDPALMAQGQYLRL
jgi:type III secretion protein HrpB1